MDKRHCLMGFKSAGWQRTILQSPFGFDENNVREQFLLRTSLKTLIGTLRKAGLAAYTRIPLINPFPLANGLSVAGLI